MPKIVERLRRQLQSRGHKKKAAYAIAHSVLQRSGSMKGGKLTARGKKRQKLGNAGRAKERAARAANKKRSSKRRSPKQYNYNPKTNRATLKKPVKRKLSAKKKTMKRR